MAELSRTVRVSGLPTDVEDDKLKDKLFIHFLRSKNGGGEIDSFTTDKATPHWALITFEDREVAQRVVQRSRHILEVDGKKYRLNVTEHHESPEPDKVIVSLSATLDCSQLPGGMSALRSLCRTHPDVQIKCDAAEVCTLHGAYSKVQAALAQILAHPGGLQSSDKDSGRPDLTGSTVARKSHSQGSESHSRKANKQAEQSETVKESSSGHRALTQSGEDSGQAQGADLRHPAASEEDFSLIVDADMYQYLQKHCRREYEGILNQHGVVEVDVTIQGLTTLFLQVAAGARGGGQEQERLASARKALIRLYQENDAKICRGQLSKNILTPTGGLQLSLEILKIKVPKLLLKEDDENVYFIGSSGDVSEAKQYLLLDHGKASAKKDDVASLLRYESYDSNSLRPAEEAGAHKMAAPEGSLTNRLARSDEDEKRADAARRYKLAPCFKESGLPTLGDRPTDLTLRGLSSPVRQTRSGPMRGLDVLSDPAGSLGERVPRAEPQPTGVDILFRGGDSFAASALNRTPLYSNSVDTRPKNLAQGTAPSRLSGYASLPPLESGPMLKRANSFSGMPEQRAQVKRSHDDSSRTSTRVRSSSFSNKIGRDKDEVNKAGITVSMIIWPHIKEAYRTQVDTLTTGVQIKEELPEGSGTVTITVSGADPSRVTSCQQGLQELVDSVSVDFCVRELPLSQLGITDPADETLQACFTEMQSRFRKINIRVQKKKLVLLGPKHLCTQLGATLQEVFSGSVASGPEEQDLFGPSSRNYSPIHVEQSFFPNSSQMIPDTGDQEMGPNHRNDNGLTNGPANAPAVKKNPVIKEKVKTLGTAEMYAQEIEALINDSTTGSTRHVNGDGSAKAAGFQKSGRKDGTQQQRAEIQDTLWDSESGQGDRALLCACKDRAVARTNCGLSMCSACLDSLHANCTVCTAAEPITPGIHGHMKRSELQMSLPGHNRNSSIKITYHIIDGIQGSDHPSPGQPFQGAAFEAYLPDCEQARRLLPRLEKAFKQGFTFTVMSTGTGDRVTWDCIPHKTSLHGGKSGKGYPDSSYLTRLSQVLTSHGIEE